MDDSYDTQDDTSDSCSLASCCDSPDSLPSLTKRKIPDVWKYFVKMKETKKVECKICNKHLAFHGGTSNLREHLVKLQPLKYTNESHSKQLPLDRVMSQKFCSGTRTKDITDRIVKMIIRDLHPIRSVECEGFRELISFLEPGYVILLEKL